MGVAAGLLSSITSKIGLPGLKTQKCTPVSGGAKSFGGPYK